MKDIRINSTFMQLQYIISWIGFIVCGFVFAWLIAIGLYTYGKDTPENKQKQSGLLNMTYQKFIFIWGSIFGDLLIIGLLITMVVVLVGKLI